MKRGFTLVEILVCTAIAALVIAIAYPAFLAAKKASQRAYSVNQLRQIYLALAVYRTGYQSVEFGDAAEMGLPPDLGSVARQQRLPHSLFFSGCPSITAPVPPFALFNVMWHEPSQTQEPWEPYVERYRQNSILVGDENCDFDVINHNNPFFPHRGLGIYEDGHARTVVRSGDMDELAWWNTASDLAGG